MILIVLPSHYPFVIATCLEFALKELAQGKQVAIVNFSWLDSKFINNRKRKFLANYTYRPRIDYVISEWCKKHKVKLLEFEVTDFINEISSIRTDSFIYEHFVRAIRSTHAKSFGSIGFDLTEFPQDELESNLQGFLLVQLIMRSLTQSFLEISNLRVVTVNGRFNIDSSVVLFCKINRIKYTVLESGLSGWNKYLEFESSIQSISELRMLMNNTWQRDVLAGKVDGKALATEHMNNRLNSRWRWSASSTANVLDKSAVGNYGVFFPSSNWEFGIFDHELSEQSQQVSQAEAFQWFTEYCNKNGLKPIVRVHPHPESLAIADLENQIWEDRIEKHKGVLVKSNGDINSHKLAENATINVVHQSSIGAELLWSGRPTVITGVTLYSELVPEFVVKTNLEFESRLQASCILKDPERLLPWAYFMEFGGNDFTHFKVLDDNFINYHNRKFISKNWLINKLLIIWGVCQRFKLYGYQRLNYLSSSRRK
jgi:hypothetical protein